PPPERPVETTKVVLPPEVERVRFTIVTPGVDAKILDARDEGEYGNTNDPAGVEVQKSDQPITLILRAPGYEDLRVEIIPNQDKKFEKSLARVAVVEPTPPATAPGATRRTRPPPS